MTPEELEAKMVAIEARQSAELSALRADNQALRSIVEELQVEVAVAEATAPDVQDDLEEVMSKIAALDRPAFVLTGGAQIDVLENGDAGFSLHWVNRNERWLLESNAALDSRSRLGEITRNGIIMELVETSTGDGFTTLTLPDDKTSYVYLRLISSTTNNPGLTPDSVELHIEESGAKRTDSDPEAEYILLGKIKIESGNITFIEQLYFGGDINDHRTLVDAAATLDSSHKISSLSKGSGTYHSLHKDEYQINDADMAVDNDDYTPGKSSVSAANKGFVCVLDKPNRKVLWINGLRSYETNALGVVTAATYTPASGTFTLTKTNLTFTYGVLTAAEEQSPETVYTAVECAS